MLVDICERKRRSEQAREREREGERANPGEGANERRGEETVAAGSTERLATVVVPAAAGVVVVVVVVVRRDTQWWNGGTKDTTVRRKRVVMGRESRGVLLLVALAVLAAVDAFSTDSKSTFFSQHARCIFVERQRAKGERGRRRGGRRERAGPEEPGWYTPSSSRQDSRDQISRFVSPVLSTVFVIFP